MNVFIVASGYWQGNEYLRETTIVDSMELAALWIEAQKLTLEGVTTEVDFQVAQAEIHNVESWTVGYRTASRQALARKGSN